MQQTLNIQAQLFLTRISAHMFAHLFDMVSKADKNAYHRGGRGRGEGHEGDQESWGCADPKRGERG